jgi:hypothetical protein
MTDQHEPAQPLPKTVASVGPALSIGELSRLQVELWT